MTKINSLKSNGSIFLFIMMMCVVFLIPHSILAAPKITYTIRGVSGPALKNVMNRLNDEEKSLYEISTVAQPNIFLNTKISTIVAKALEPYGYFEPIITTTTAKQTPVWHILINIQLGKPIKINLINLQITGEGETNKSFRQAIANFPLKIGDILNTEKYDDIKKQWLILANKQGFLEATFDKAEIVVDKQQYKANINLQFNTGPQYYFGPITFHQSTYDLIFLRRFVHFNEGDPYSPEALLALQQDLSGTTYFSQVDASSSEKQTLNHRIPIDITLSPSKSQAYQVGLGYGTDTNIRLTTTWDWLHLNDHGHHMKTFLQLSEVQSTFDFRYIIPGINPLTDQHFIGLSVLQEQPNNSQDTTEKLTVGKQDLFYRWKRTLSLSYQHDKYRIRKDSTRTSHLLLPSLVLSQNTYDNIIFPRHGYSTSIQLLGAYDKLLSSTTFAELHLTSKFVFSHDDNSRILLRNDLGYTLTNNLQTIPVSLQFFAGGTESIRGYDYQQLGPGKYLIVASAEYQHRITGKIFGTTFIDLGNAFNSFHNLADNFIGYRQPGIHLNDLFKTSIGVGVMYASPVGPIELTVAKPVTDPHRSPMIQFSMGVN